MKSISAVFFTLCLCGLVLLGMVLPALAEPVPTISGSVAVKSAPEQQPDQGAWESVGSREKRSRLSVDLPFLPQSPCPDQSSQFPFGVLSRPPSCAVPTGTRPSLYLLFSSYLI